MITSHDIPLTFGPWLTQMHACSALPVRAGVTGANADADSPALALMRAP